MYIDESVRAEIARVLNRPGARTGTTALPLEKKAERPAPDRPGLPEAALASHRTPDGQSLDAMIAAMVAKHTEALVEKVSARVLQQVLAELDARKKPTSPMVVSNSDPIESIPIPKRVMTALRRMRIRTIGELTALRQERLLKTPSLGEGSVRQLNWILAVYGRRLAV